MRSEIKPRQGKLGYEIISLYSKAECEECQSMIAGSRFKKYNCIRCGEKGFQHHNTYTPKVCHNCFVFDECVYCLEKILYK